VANGDQFFAAQRYTEARPMPRRGVCMSGCLSLHLLSLCIASKRTSKRLNISSNFFYLLVAPPSS